jgi:hypothetical protein
MTDFANAYRPDRRRRAGRAVPLGEVIEFAEVCSRISPAIGAMLLTAYDLHMRVPTFTGWEGSPIDGRGASR